MMTTNESFADVARHRSNLGQAMRRVEEAAAAPAAKESWATDLLNGLQQLQLAFNDHILEVQSPEGLLYQIVDQAPRLQRMADNMKLEDSRIAESIRAALELTSMDRPEQAVVNIRESVLDLLVDLARHRQQGADLMYEAYAVDIGGY